MNRSRVSPLRAAWIPASLMIVAVLAGHASAADGAVAAAQPLTWRQLIEYGGWLMYVLGAMSVAALALVVYLFAVVRPGQVTPALLSRELADKIGAGALDDARRVAEFKPCALSSVILSVLDYMRQVPEADPLMLKDVAQGEGTRQADLIQGRAQYLLDIAAIAPMVGLLGTVVGMVKAFGAVASDIASAKPIVLAAGVSQALVTTEAGLVIAIPAMMFYAYFRRRASRTVAQLESVTAELLALLQAKRV